METRYVLRASDIKGLEFADIDWKEKNFSISQSKTGNSLVLPLLDDIGWIIIDYIGKTKPGDPITKELFEEWTQKRDYETAASHRIRYDILARFCTDLNNTGAQKYIKFHSIRRGDFGRGFSPYIFTADEIIFAG